MNPFKSISAKDITDNPFKLIGDDWTLITAGNKNGYNTMTASWGGVGVLWRKNVVYIFVRPQRYTKEFLDRETNFSLSFFENEREALSFCGSHSGRDCDKAAETGLTPIFSESAPYFEQARLVLICKKLYCQPFDPNCVIDKSVLDNYENNDFHYVYVGEIEKVLSK